MRPPIPGNPKRLLVAGDTHGNWLHWKHVLLPAAHEHQVEGIVQLGDFGYWPLTGEGRDYLAWLSSELDDADSWIVFVDGNHEDHKALRQLPRRPDGFVEVTDRIVWAPRGHRWTWGGVRFLALGGAYSIDRQYRKLDSGRWGWFKEEVITSEQAKLASAGGAVDVLLTHDAPLGAQPRVRMEGVPKHSPGAQHNLGLVQEVAESTEPKLLLHGHWHQFQQVRLPGRETEVIGLSMDGTEQSWLVLDLPGLEITPAPTTHSTLDPFAELEDVGGGYRVADIERALLPEQLADFARRFRGHTGMIDRIEGPIIYRSDCERWLRCWLAATGGGGDE
ncbi:MAG: metallophosphoesterase [Candidatus Dormibacteraeota bacterium]|nr:metallophosphoesterase [Candidatus Dormibacteraeota bacterium]